MYSMRGFVLLIFIKSIDAARILAIIPAPSISHQIFFRPLTQQLAKQGHNVVVITANPAFSKEETLENLTEIDVGKIIYPIFRSHYTNLGPGKENQKLSNLILLLKVYIELTRKIFEAKVVQDIIEGKHGTFDLILLESCFQHVIAMVDTQNIPVIYLSSTGGMYGDYERVGASTHPIIYPQVFRNRLVDLSFYEIVTESIMTFLFKTIQKMTGNAIDAMVRKDFTSLVKNLNKYDDEIDMILTNTHPFFEFNRPTPLGVIHIGGLHQQSKQVLTQDLQTFLDSSVHGAIYISFGSNVGTSSLPLEKIKIMINVLSGLPYNVLWKWDEEELPGKSSNIRIYKWLPQAVLLKHPKVKLFITQGGLQSTEESIMAGVPMIGMPQIVDQHFNTEKYIYFGIGVKLNMDTLTEDQFRDAIKIAANESYTRNLAKVQSLMLDQPQDPLERATWWINHVIQHGTRHLRSPGANISWTEYVEIELIAIVVIVALASVTFFLYLGFFVFMFTKRILSQ